MKKIVIAVLVVALIVAIGTVSAFAAGPSVAARRYYMDADGDGVCDNYVDCSSSQYYVDADGDGVCDNYGDCGNYGACGNNAGRGNCRGQRHGINW